MALTSSQISSLLDLIASARVDAIDCDSCLDQIAEFADTKLAEQEVPDALKAVETHLDQCMCCKDEYNALLDGLRALDERE